MHRRKWDTKTKIMIVIDSLKGKPIAELCNEHQIIQSEYDQWRDQFLTHAASAFEVHQHTRKEAHLEQEHTRLKRLVGELLLELKKATRCSDEPVTGRRDRSQKRPETWVTVTGVV